MGTFKRTYKVVLLGLLLLMQVQAQAGEYSIDYALKKYWSKDTASYSMEAHSQNFGSIELSPRSYKSDLNIYHFTLLDLKDVVTAPLRWKQKEWAKVGVVAIGTGALIMLDDDIYNFIQGQKTPFTENATKYAFEPFGNYATFGLLAGMFSYGLISGKSRPQATALLAAESYLITGLITLIPKTLAGRARPHSIDPPNHLVWQGPFHGKSFWSGHTAVAFSVASVIASMYNDNKTIQIAAYTTAALTGLSRIHDTDHWASDVVVGALVGAAIGQLIVRNYKSRLLKVTPIISPEFQSLNIQLTF